MAKLSRAEAEKQGRRAETLAAWYLRLKGWRILATRLKTPRGEIDLVAKRGRTVAFVEVKHRQTAADLDHALDKRRLQRVAAATESVAHIYASDQDSISIDAILVAPGRWPHHLANIWHDQMG
ncbi:MAG: YraN family protein [Pseudomonadota bacterium]